MTNEEKVRLILCVAGMIFQSKLGNTDITQVNVITNTGTWPGRTFVDGKLRGFDITVQDNSGVVPLRILEQNPDKMDQFNNLKQNAILARQGHQIAWVIRQDTNTFLGKVMDGKWETDGPRATTNVQFNSGQPAETPMRAQDQYGGDYQHYDDGSWERELPDITVGEIPLYVTGV